MIRIACASILGIVSVLFGGVAHAFLAHTENNNIVGISDGDSVCFNNDGAIASISECSTTIVDEGLVYSFNSYWNGGGGSGINGCGTDPVNPVSSAICPYTKTSFDFCINSKFVLVQTIRSGHYWVVKANSDCTGIETPETTGLVPCLSTDSFHPDTGCTRSPPSPNPPVIGIEGGYLKPNAMTVPPDEHCDDVEHVGRIVVDGRNDIIYVCTPTGWSTH